ncbi:MAG TPA: nuclear transport factor 2 family protein [Terriglobia bacterium]|nr:nuclear transport factor 2 family protein [Terriglobia bacterium]
MNAKLDPLVVDRHFFASLIEANLLALDQVLAGDFVLIDVMNGSEVTKSALLAVIGSGQVRFESIEPGDNLVRLYQTTAVITGRTRMKGRLGDAPFAASSRYTHVFVMQQGKWRLVAAQGTQISPSPEPPHPQGQTPGIDLRDRAERARLKL